MGKIYFKIIKNKNNASMGIGAMVIFIAMVLVAGIAASVLIQTSTTLESQALSTGKETTVEVSSGMAVTLIEGYAATGSNISKLAIMVRPHAGAEFIDVAYTFIELADETKKVVLNYSTTWFLEPDGRDDIFGSNVFPNNGGAGDASQFGALVIEDADNSITSKNAILINRGDKVYLCVNTTACFGNIPRNTDIQGCVVPESGSPGVIKFKTPYSYSDVIMKLQ